MKGRASIRGFKKFEEERDGRASDHLCGVVFGFLPRAEDKASSSETRWLFSPLFRIL
jgi:hypothetical protein